MKYLSKSPFSSKPSSREYRDGWDATFPSRSVQRRQAAMKGEPMPEFEPGSNKPKKRRTP